MRARGRSRGAPDVGREADGANRGSTFRGPENTGREGWQTVPGRVQTRTEEGCRGSDSGGVWYGGPQPLYLHDGVYHSEGRIFCVSSDVVVDWLAPVLIVTKTSSMIGDGFEARHFENGTGWARRSGSGVLKLSPVVLDERSMLLADDAERD